MNNKLYDNRFSKENKSQFENNGWTLVDLKLSKESINNALNGLMEMKKSSIQKDYKPRRIYYDHLIRNNHAAIELPFNKKICNENVRNFFNEAKKLKFSENLVLSGGCALNSLSNGKIMESENFKNIFVPYSPGDSGGVVLCGSPGSNVEVQHSYSISPNVVSPQSDGTFGASGPGSPGSPTPGSFSRSSKDLGTFPL